MRNLERAEDISADAMNAVRDQLGASPGDTMLIVADKPKVAAGE